MGSRFASQNRNIPGGLSDLEVIYGQAL